MSLKRTGIICVTFTTAFYTLITVTKTFQLVSDFPPFDTSNTRSTYFYTMANKRARGGKMMTIQVRNKWECVQKCSILADGCIDVNFKKDSKHGLHDCEIIQERRDDFEDTEDDDDAQFDHIAMLIPNFPDCAKIYKTNAQSSGLYRIRPVSTRSITTYCDMDTSGGGWTVIQKRLDGSVDFNRDWAEYKKGFGNKLGEYWLGLDAIHSMTSRGDYRLRIDLEDFDGSTGYAEYDSFKVAGEAELYRLYIAGYTGNTTDSLTPHNEQPFSARDRDNDALPDFFCSNVYRSGWWFKGCHQSNLNGVYLNGSHTLYIGMGVCWYPWKSLQYSLRKAEMKIRPKDF